MRTPPGPRGGWLLGVGPAIRRDLLGFMRTLPAYGGIVHYRVARLRFYQLHDPQLIKLVLQDYNDHCQKTWELRQLKMLLGRGLLTNEGEPWRQQRRQIQPAFHNDRIRRYGEVMGRYTEQALDHWLHAEQRDLSEDMMQLTLRIVAKTLFGLDISREIQPVGEALEVFMRQFERLLMGWLPLPLSWPTPNNLRARRAARRLRDRVRDFMAQRRAEGAEGDDLLSWLLAGQAGSGMDDEQILDEVITLLLAGHETTANALTWTLMLLAQHPEVAERLRAEVDAVLDGRPPRVTDVPSLGYTQQVIKESMRLYPPAWAQTREVVTPFELDGYPIPKGAVIIFAQYVIQRDERWFEDPEAFRPERWTEQFSQQLPKYAYFPFGGGPRFCVGSNFANLEATLILAEIARRFEWEIAPDARLELQPSVTLRPRHGMPARVYLRQPQRAVAASG